MDPGVQIPKVLFEILSVVRPRNPIDPRRGPGLQRPIRRPQAIDIDVVQERSEPRVLIPFRDSPHTKSSGWRRPG